MYNHTNEIKYWEKSCKFSEEQKKKIIKNVRYMEQVGKKLKKVKRKHTLSYERVHKLLYYDYMLGHFYWMACAGKKKKGKRAECRCGDNYRTITIDGTSYAAHRIAFLYMEGYFPEHEIDHINMRKYDNRWKNLRHVTRSCNARNTKITKRNSSAVKGVTKQGKSWAVTIGVEGKNIRLNSYPDLYTAVKVRWEAEKIFNYPDCQTTSTAFVWLQKYNEKQEEIKFFLKSMKDLTHVPTT